MEWLRRVWYLFNRSRREAELAKEMATHREMMGHGDSRSFGNELRLREDAREVWGWAWLDRLWQDLTYGARMLRRSPGFTVPAVLGLALGIGVTLTSLRVVLGQLHPNVPDPDTLVSLDRRAPGHRTGPSYPVLAFYREHARSLQSIIGRLDATVMFGDEPEPVATAFVTANYVSEFGIPALSGRLLSSTIDEAAAAEPVALLGQGFWERRLGGDKTVIGRTIRLNGKPVRVVGVLGTSREQVAVWMPLVKQPYLVEGSTFLTEWGGGLRLYGRLRAGIGPQRVEEETRTLAVTLRKQWPNEVHEGEWLGATPLGQLELKDSAKVLMAVALVGLLLVAACTNLGTLLLARGLAREREIRTRMALGADRRRVVRQLLTESLLLAVLSSVAGLLLSTVALRTMQSASVMPEGSGMELDWRVLAATLAIALVAAATFGLAPALRLTSGAPQAGRARSVFLALQVGASCMFLMVAGLLVRGFERLATADPGFDYSRIVVIQPGLGSHGYKGVAAQSYLQTLRDRLHSIPGVQRTSVMELAPWGNQAWHEGRRGYRVNFNRVDAEFLPTLGLRLVSGRNLLPGEKGVAIVSATLARRLWPGENPLGKTLEIGDGGTVVGVVASAGTFNLRTEDPMGVYFPLKENEGMDALVARVVGPPGKYLEAFAASAKALDRRLQPNVRLLQAEFDRAKDDNLQLVTIVGLLGTFATVLAMVGLAGLTAYSVGQRTREIGVRIALGAQRSQVVKAVLKPVLSPVIVGFLAGALGAVGLSSVLRSEIFGLRLLEPMAYLMAIALFTAVVALATMAPARRAMRVNPSDALRHE